MTVQQLLAVITAVGGVSGIGAFITVLLQRKKIRADAADVITDTALTLVEPLQKRVTSLEVEAEEMRRKYRRLSDKFDAVLRVLHRWRDAMLDAAVSRDRLREMAEAQADIERTGG